MRMFAPILAGSIKLSFKRFLLLDAIALVVFTSLYLSLGIIFHESLTAIVRKTKELKNIIFFAAVFVMAAIIIFFVMKRNKQKKENESIS
jgi:membrane protein DedA with SNARE-associated domain